MLSADLQIPDVPPVSLAAVVTTRKPAGEENSGSSTQGEAVDKHHCSSSEYHTYTSVLI